MTGIRSMRHVVWYLAGVLIAALLLTALSNPGSRGLAAETEQRKVTVNGMAELRVDPDEATVNLGVQTQADTADAASQANSTAMEKVIAVLRQAGISENDIQTNHFSIYPIHDMEILPAPDAAEMKPGEPVIRGYRAENTVRFTTRDLKGLGGLIDQAVKAGANTVHGIEFGISDPQSLEQEAFKKALDHARSKAEYLARAAGVSLGEVLQIEEFGSRPTPVFMAADAAGAARSAAVPVKPGQVDYALQVRISYALN